MPGITRLTIQSTRKPDQLFTYLQRLDQPSVWYRNHLCADPIGRIECHGSDIKLFGEFFETHPALEAQRNPADALENQLTTLIEKSLEILTAEHAVTPDRTNSHTLGEPGFYGYFSYEFYNQVNRWVYAEDALVKLPQSILSLHPWVISHAGPNEYVVACLGTPDQYPAIHRIQQFLAGHDDRPQHDPAPFKLTSKLTANMTQSDYKGAFNRIKTHIDAGDVYQVNLAQQFSGSFVGDPLLTHTKLKQAYPAPYSGFMRYPWGDIATYSPELFLSVTGDQITTRPIKGTCPRSNNPLEDHQAAQNLADSAKNRAENLMIVDLLRNDLSRSCRAGSVQVPELWTLERYANVHHLVSTIIGQLKPNLHPLRALFNAFPGGSITGAPKRRAMELIRDLEPDPRLTYCGALGFFNIHRQLEMNINIRSLVFERTSPDQGIVRAWGGGGIVKDSECTSEYQESLTKIAPLLETLSAFK